MQTDHPLSQWKESAHYWSKHSEKISRMFAPVSRALLEEAGIKPGQTVLDVAGGVGDPSLDIAESTRPGGFVFATDAIEQMLKTSRMRASSRSINNISFTRCVGEALPFESSTFDVVVCRFGVMLFSDPATSIAEMLRVLKPGGRLALAVWSRQDANPFFYVVAEIVSRYVDSDPPDSDAPGAFRFAQPKQLMDLVAQAGGASSRERLLECDLEASVTPEQYWALRIEMSDTLRGKVALLDEGSVNAVAREVCEKSLQFYKDGTFRFPAQVILVSASKRT